MTVTKIKSIPATNLDPSLLGKLASRHGIPVATLANKHVLFVADRPNEPTPDGATREAYHRDRATGRVTKVAEPYFGREVTTAFILDSPVTLDVVASGTAIKSTQDASDETRGMVIALSRAVKAIEDGAL